MLSLVRKNSLCLRLGKSGVQVLELPLGALPFVPARAPAGRPAIQAAAHYVGMYSEGFVSKHVAAYISSL